MGERRIAVAEGGGQAGEQLGEADALDLIDFGTQGGKGGGRLSIVKAGEVLSEGGKILGEFAVASLQTYQRCGQAVGEDGLSRRGRSGQITGEIEVADGDGVRIAA